MTDTEQQIEYPDLSHLTVDDLKEWLAKQDLNRNNPVDEHGNCQYLGSNGVHCIVGQFYYDHGVSDEILRDEAFENVSAHSTAPWFNINDDLRDELDDLQSHADIGTQEALKGHHKLLGWAYGARYSSIND